jgi:hypothetical protein
MAKVSISGRRMVIESVATIEELKSLERFNQDALILKDSDKRPIFVVGAGDRPSIGALGVQFAGNGYGTDAKATIEVDLPVAAAENPKQYIAENYGGVIRNLNTVEQNLKSAIETVAKEQEAIVASIEG